MNLYKYHITLVLLFWFSSLSNSIFSSQKLTDVRGMVQEWVELRKTASQEEVQWKAKKVQLQDLTNATRLEVESLTREAESLSKHQNQANVKRQELLNRQKQLKENITILAEFLGKMEKEVFVLKEQLPSPLQEKLSPFYQRIPSEESAGSLSLADRMQNVVGILSMVQKFNNQISIHEEIRDLNNGKQGEVRTLYLGLGAAYYLASSGEDAGYGYPSENGWKWTSQPELAELISENLNIADNLQQEARFISLPVSIKD